MNCVFLKALSAANYAPFANEVKFTTQVDNSKKEYMENTFEVGDNRLNKVSIVYGANGAGKTFFCKILREIQRLLDWSPLVNSPQFLCLPELKSIDSTIPTFSFDPEFKEKPSSFMIEIILDKTTYHYEFELMGKKICYELLTKKHRRTEKLLERKSSSYKDIVFRSEMKSFDINKHVIKEESLSLSMAAFLNNELAIRIVTAIGNINILNMTAPRIQPSDSENSFSENRLQKYVNVLKRADPTLRKLFVDVKEEDIRQIIESDDFENREIIAKKTTVAIHTEHAVFSGSVEKSSKQIEFFRDESLGTVKLFTILPHLYDVLEAGGVLILDEIENGLHLSLVVDIINLFNSPESNPHNAQLICTSHQPLLVNRNTRRDQVWTISKDIYGKSQIKRISEMSPSRASVNLTNRIIEGAFGCNPEPFFSDHIEKDK